MNLWLDDIRDPNEYGHIGWHWVRTAEEAVAWLIAYNVEVEEASLDHDLGFSRFYPTQQPTGYDIVCYLERNPELWPSKGVKVHSSNPCGAARMQQVIDRHYKR